MDSADVLAQLKQKIAAYRPSRATCDLVRTTRKLFLVGISGAGKDTIMRQLLKTGKYYVIVSHTTRAPRVNDGVPEQNGVDYNFITLAQAEQMLDAGSYVEAKLYGSNIYGTSVSELQRAHDLHKIAATDIEVQGVAEYVHIDPTTKAVFVLPPNYQAWQVRLRQRYGGSVSGADLAERFAAAQRELAHALDAPYYHFVINDDLDSAVAEIDAIASNHEDMQEAAHARHVAREILEQLNHTSPKTTVGSR